MRVLHLDTGREMRGGQWQVLHLLRGFPSALMARAGSPLFEAARREGFEVTAFSVGALALKARRFDLLHAHDARAHAAAAWIAPDKLVVSRRVAFPIHTGWLSRGKYARAAHYIAVSDFVRRRLEDSGVDGNRISVVYDGVPLPAALGDHTGAAVAPASDDPRKGSNLARQAAELAGIGLCFSRDLPSDLAHASIFVYLTEEEGLGSAALLAMAHGVPVIASLVGGLPEAIGDAGVLVDNDAAAVAGAIRVLRGDRKMAARLALAGRSRVEKGFTVAMMVERTRAVYRKVLGC